GADLQPAVEIQEILGAVLRGQRRRAVGEGARGARLRVPARLKPAPLRGLVPAPRDAERRQREEQRRRDLEPPPARRRRLTGLTELVRRVDVHVFGHDRGSYGVRTRY